MPLLPAEPFVFPEELLDQPFDPTNGCLPWWVLHTRPRAEKALARKLLRHHTPYFLPTRKKQWRKHGRMFSSHVPLFPGYLFIRADHLDAFRTLETNFVARVLRVPDRFQIHTDLERIHRLIASGGAQVSEDRLQPGALVEIIAGPLSGLEGKIIRRGKQLKFIVEVHFLQQGVSVEIESWMIEPRSSSHRAAPARAHKS